MDNIQAETEHWSIVHSTKQTAYHISSHGRAKSIHIRTNKETILKQFASMRYGKPRYLKTGLGAGTKYIHRLVALHFVPNPHNKPEVNHKDGNKANNHYTNLEWCTQLENNDHAVRIGLAKRGNKPKKPYQRMPKEMKKNIKRAVIQVDCNGNELARFDSIKDAAEKVRATIPGICNVASGRQISTRGTYWRYR